MDRPGTSIDSKDVARALLGLGGHGTLGDIVLTTGIPCADVEHALEALMACGQVHVAVSESAVLTYRLDEGRRHVKEAGSPTSLTAFVHRWPVSSSRGATRRYDRKTLRLIRARGGVISLAELVEHTGLSVPDAAREVWRLAGLYGGEAHPSLDGHTVYAFPEIMVSAHDRFSVREPRPAWVRARDPMRRPAALEAGIRARVRLGVAGVLTPILATVAATIEPALAASTVVLVLTAVTATAGATLLAYEAVRRIRDARGNRFRDEDTLRRYALGHVFETALKGKGVVSLESTRRYLQARAGSQRVRRSTVERALRRLAGEFDAQITELNGDLFFGFRNVKRQFLASHLERQRLQLREKAEGGILFDSGDSALAAAERDFEGFDRALLEERYDPIALDARDSARVPRRVAM